jgi:hypothetical protein
MKMEITSTYNIYTYAFQRSVNFSRSMTVLRNNDNKHKPILERTEEYQNVIYLLLCFDTHRMRLEPRGSVFG